LFSITTSKVSLTEVRKFYGNIGPFPAVVEVNECFPHEFSSQ